MPQCWLQHSYPDVTVALCFLQSSKNYCQNLKLLLWLALYFLQSSKNYCQNLKLLFSFSATDTYFYYTGLFRYFVLFYFLVSSVVLVNLMFYFILYLNFHYQPPRLVHLGTSYCYLPLYCHSVSSSTIFNIHTYLIHVVLRHGCLTSKMKALWSLKTLGTDIQWLSHPRRLESSATRLWLCLVSCSNELFVFGKCYKEQLSGMCCSWFIQDMSYCMYMPVEWWR